MAAALDDIANDAAPKQRLLRTQLALVLRLLPRLRAAAQEVVSTPVRGGAEESVSGASVGRVAQVGKAPTEQVPGAQEDQPTAANQRQ
jgi:hypothetical protein